MTGITVYPDTAFKIIIPNLNVGISGSENTFFDTTFVWIKSVSAPQPEYGKIISNTVSIGPRLVPYRNEMKIEFRLNEEAFRDSSIAIYYFDKKKATSWNIIIEPRILHLLHF